MQEINGFELVYNVAVHWYETYEIEIINKNKAGVAMSEAESNLREFCINEGFDAPEVLYESSDDMVDVPNLNKQYLGIELILDGVTTAETDNRYDEIARHIVAFLDKIPKENTSTTFLTKNSPMFDRYFINLTNVPNKHSLQRKTVAVLDDQGDSDNDLLFTTDGLVQIVKGRMKEPVAYDDIKLLENDKGLMISQEYENGNVSMYQLISLIRKLRTNPVIQVHESKNPVDMIFSLFKK